MNEFCKDCGHPLWQPDGQGQSIPATCECQPEDEDNDPHACWACGEPGAGKWLDKDHGRPICCECAIAQGVYGRS